jgi:hypothetical protein
VIDPDDVRVLSRAARERGISRLEFIRQHLALVLEQYRRHPKPRSAGIVRALTERGDERELFSAGDEQIRRLDVAVDDPGSRGHAKILEAEYSRFR